MKPSTRLQPVIDRAAEHEQAAASALAEAGRRLDSASHKLAELQDYRNEYVEGLRVKTQVGLNAMQMRDYQVFLTRLDAAIGQQRQVIAGLRQEAERARRNWLVLKQRRNALGRLHERHCRREHAEYERREQAETNEHALRRWRRVPE